MGGELRRSAASSAALHEWNPQVSGVTRGCGQSCGECAHRGQEGRPGLTCCTAQHQPEALSLAAGRSALRAGLVEEHALKPLQTSRSSLGGRSQRRRVLVAGNRPPKPDHSISAPNPTQHGTMRRSGNTKTGNELGAARSNMSEPYMPTCTTNPAVPAMTKQPTPSKTASGRHAIRRHDAVATLAPRPRGVWCYSCDDADRSWFTLQDAYCQVWGRVVFSYAVATSWGI